MTFNIYIYINEGIHIKIFILDEYVEKIIKYKFFSDFIEINYINNFKKNYSYFCRYIL